MASTKASLPHLERTAADPRDHSLHAVKISKIEPINSTIRLYHLTPLDAPIKFLPGQWLDVYIPSLPQAGGFTITSAPTITTHIELAIQKSSNPPAKWLWQPPSSIIGKELNVRVGGSFVWPPLLRKEGKEEGIKRVVFVAGGVGINPLMSMVSFIAGEKEKGRLEGFEVRFLYSSKKEKGEEVLFLERLLGIFKSLGEEGKLSLFFTGGKEGQEGNVVEVEDQKFIAKRRRIDEGDLLDALGPVQERGNTVCYICGVPSMTDEFIELVKSAEGMKEENVLFEKWW